MQVYPFLKIVKNIAKQEVWSTFKVSDVHYILHKIFLLTNLFQIILMIFFLQKYNTLNLQVFEM